MSGDLELNKIFAAILVTALGYMGIKELAHSMIHVQAPDTPAYALALPEVGGAKVEEIIMPFPQTEWVAAMDATRGAKVFKKCTSCHNNEAGGKHSTGPNLYNIVGSQAASKDGFGYSSAMNSAGLTWDYETLDKYLTRPGKFVSGTAMSFVGLKKDKDRAAVIEFLRQGSAEPIAQPEVAVLPEVEGAVEHEGEMPAVEMPSAETPVVATPAEDAPKTATPKTDGH